MKSHSAAFFFLNKTQQRRLVVKTHKSNFIILRMWRSLISNDRWGLIRDIRHQQSFIHLYLLSSHYSTGWENYIFASLCREKYCHVPLSQSWHNVARQQRKTSAQKWICRWKGTVLLSSQVVVLLLKGDWSVVGGVGGYDAARVHHVLTSHVGLTHFSQARTERRHRLLFMIWLSGCNLI